MTLTLAFTGHRPDKLGGYAPCKMHTDIRYVLAHVLDRLKPDTAISGMALGFDQMAAEACIAMAIPFIAAVPFEGQESKWPDQSKAHYQYLLGQAQKVLFVSEPGYAIWKMHARNKWMVDNCDLLIALWDGSSGGTASCIEYAKSVKKPVINLFDSVMDVEFMGPFARVL